MVNGHGIISWAAVDISRLDGQNDELIGFVTARIIPVTESEVFGFVILKCHDFSSSNIANNLHWYIGHAD